MSNMPLPGFSWPRSPWRLTFQEPKFIRLETDTQPRWFLIGPDWTLPTGQVIKVRSYRNDNDREVLVGEHLMEHEVHHTGDRAGTSTRYVIASIWRTTNQGGKDEDPRGAGDRR